MENDELLEKIKELSEEIFKSEISEVDLKPIRDFCKSSREELDKLIELNSIFERMIDT